MADDLSVRAPEVPPPRPSVTRLRISSVCVEFEPRRENGVIIGAPVSIRLTRDGGQRLGLRAGELIAVPAPGLSVAALLSEVDIGAWCVARGVIP